VAEAPRARLIIEKYYYGFRFYFDDPNDKRSWFVKHNYGKPMLFTLVEEEDRQAVRVVDESYANAGVGDLCGLLIMISMHPSETIEALLGEKVQIGEVIIRDYIEWRGKDFESCSIREMVEPKDAWVDWE